MKTRRIFLVGIFMASTCLRAETPEPSMVVSNCRISLLQRASLAGSRMGILQDIDVSEGDVVERGQIVATLRDELPQQTLAIAQKEMSNNVEVRLYKKISELATLEYSKAVDLNRSIPGGFSELDIKKLRLAAEKSVLQIEQADYLQQMSALRKKEAEVILDSYRITAPFSGVVLQVHKQPGEAIGSGDAVVEIANFDLMRVEGFIPVAASGKVHAGDAVVVDVAAIESQRPSRFEGRVKFISPIVNEVSQEVRIWAEVKNRRNLLKDGLPATMWITPSESKSGEIVSEAARRQARKE
jgi:membrane fusion protein (multidrug efflux system)